MHLLYPWNSLHKGSRMFQTLQCLIYLITIAQVLSMKNSLKPTILESASMGPIKSIYSCDFISTNPYLEYNNIPFRALTRQIIRVYIKLLTSLVFDIPLVSGV